MWPTFNRRMRPFRVTRRVTEVAARIGLVVFSASVVRLSGPRMSLVSMANSGRISKRPILPASRGGPASTCTPEYAWPTAHGATVPGYPSAVVSVGQRRVRHLLDANRRRRGRPGSARRTIRAVRSSRLPRLARWRHPPPHIAPGKRDPRGRPHRRPTAPRRRRATPPPHPGSMRRVARRPVAGRIAGSTGGDGPSRRRSRPDRTSGTVGGGRGGSRLPTLVGRVSQSRYH
jgi:hypothetical protein